MYFCHHSRWSPVNNKIITRSSCTERFLNRSEYELYNFCTINWWRLHTTHYIVTIHEHPASYFRKLASKKGQVAYLRQETSPGDTVTERAAKRHNIFTLNLSFLLSVFLSYSYALGSKILHMGLLGLLQHMTRKTMASSAPAHGNAIVMK